MSDVPQVGIEAWIKLAADFRHTENPYRLVDVRMERLEAHVNLLLERVRCLEHAAIAAHERIRNLEGEKP